MHELGITMEMVDMALDRAGGRRVRRLRVSVGRLAAVDVESLRFCFEACADKTLLEGAELVLEVAAGKARCRDCGFEKEISRPHGRCTCGSSSLEVLSGYDVMLMDMEVS